MSGARRWRGDAGTPTWIDTLRFPMRHTMLFLARRLVACSVVALALAACNATESNQPCTDTPVLTVSADPAPKFDWTPATCAEPWLSVQDLTAAHQPVVWTIVDTDTRFLPPVTYGVMPAGHDAGTVQVAAQPLVAGHSYKVTLYRERAPGDNFPLEVASTTFTR